jgi:hypothetical protein
MASRPRRSLSQGTNLKRVADVGAEYRAAMGAGAGLELVGLLLARSCGACCGLADAAAAGRAHQPSRRPASGPLRTRLRSARGSARRCRGRGPRGVAGRAPGQGPAPRPARATGARDLPERLAVDLRVDRGARGVAVSQHLPDLGQRRTGAQHLRRRRVPQPVRVDLAESGSERGRQATAGCGRSAGARPPAC